MSISADLADPDGSVLWYWFNTVHKSSSENTQETIRDRIRRFERFLAVKGGYKNKSSWTKLDIDDVPVEEIFKPRNVDQEIAYEFLDEYLTEDYGAETQQGTAGSLSRAYEWCATHTQSVDGDPVGYVLDNHDLLDNPTPRTPYIIDIKEAREVIRSWDHPMWLCINVILAKTLRRTGGVVNLDIGDLNIDHPGCDWTVDPEIRHWPDHIVFHADKERSNPGRNTGNKTTTTRKIPIDDELKESLIWYLTVRPGPLNPDEPLFRDAWGNRRSGNSVCVKFIERAKELGHWYGERDDDNLNPHYWRHWSTTWFEDRLGEKNSLTDYLRGDKGRRTKATYNQWTEQKEALYLEHVPKFFIDD
jgi:integrase